MATRADFSEQEWEALHRGLMGAGLLVSVSDRSFFDSFKEAGALAKHVAEARRSGSSELIRELATTRGTGFGLTSSPDEIERETLAALSEAKTALESKAPEELEAYRQLVVDVARSVGDAAGGGEAAESGAIDKVEAALRQVIDHAFACWRPASSEKWPLAPKPFAAEPRRGGSSAMGGLTAWQGLFVHGRLTRGEQVLVTGASGGVGHLAVQLARHAGAAVVQSGPADLVFDTRGGEVPAGERVVTIAEEIPRAIYFIVEPDREQLLELTGLVDAGALRTEVDSVFPLTAAVAAFERIAAHGKRGKVVLKVGAD